MLALLRSLQMLETITSRVYFLSADVNHYKSGRFTTCNFVINRDYTGKFGKRKTLKTKYIVVTIFFKRVSFIYVYTTYTNMRVHR